MSDIQHISSLKLTNFKQFEHLEVENIGQFNLIVGDNNVGKTSLLEALLVHYDEQAKFEYWLLRLAVVLRNFRGVEIKDPYFFRNYIHARTSADQENEVGLSLELIGGETFHFRV